MATLLRSTQAARRADISGSLHTPFFTVPKTYVQDKTCADCACDSETGFDSPSARLSLNCKLSRRDIPDVSLLTSQECEEDGEWNDAVLMDFPAGTIFVEERLERAPDGPIFVEEYQERAPAGPISVEEHQERPERGDTIMSYDDRVGEDSLEACCAHTPYSTSSECGERPCFSAPAYSTVTLQLYHMSRWAQRSDLPIFHLGVEVYGREYFFTAAGISSCTPGKYAADHFVDAIPLGGTMYSQEDILFMLRRMQQEWHSKDYSILGQNCQDFALAFCEKMGVHDQIPTWVCRFAGMRSVLPTSLFVVLQAWENRLGLIAQVGQEETKLRTASNIGTGLSSAGSGRLVAVVPTTSPTQPFTSYESEPDCTACTDDEFAVP